MTKLNYVAGLVFNKPLDKVLLIKKIKPEWLAGRWNGIGGKVEPGEKPRDAMVRECWEECGLRIYGPRWKKFCIYHHNRIGVTDHHIHWYYTIAHGYEYLEAFSKEKESVQWWNFAGEIGNPTSLFVTNVKFLIPMALACLEMGTMKEIKLYEEVKASQQKEKENVLL